MPSLAKKLGVQGVPNAKPGRESPLVTAILRALQLKGVWAWRVNSSLRVIAAEGKSRRRVIKGAEAGSPDILLIIPRDVLLPRRGDVGLDAALVGQLCGLEVKTATGKQLPSQRAWETKAASHGVRYAVVRGIGEALATVECWSTGKPVVVRDSVRAGGKGGR